MPDQKDNNSDWHMSGKMLVIMVLLYVAAFCLLVFSRTDPLRIIGIICLILGLSGFWWLPSVKLLK